MLKIDFSLDKHCLNLENLPIYKNLSIHFLELDIAIVAQFCKYTKKIHLHFKRVNFMVCESDLKKAITKKITMTNL